jgi:hypothetical protein
VTQTISAGVADLRSEIGGPVIVPGDPDFDDRRRVWNAEIDRRPSVIARCTSAADVAAALALARQQGLEVAVRGGAHNSAGTAICDDGIMIDLSVMNSVTVDPQARTATVGGGALLADLDAAAQRHGLAVPAGLISHTGVGGLTLGGGMGWLTRKFGLSIDNLLSAEVVISDGRVLRASQDQNPDLFWAIRGGGGNFGVVTKFEFALHEVDPMAQLGMFFWGIEQGPQVLRLAREIAADLPPDLNIVIAGLNAPPEPFVPEQHQLAPGYAILLTGFGAQQQHAGLSARIRAELPPLFDMETPIPYVQLQQLLDKASAWGFHSYEKGAYLADISDGVIQAITEHLPRKSSPMSMMLLYRLDGAYSRPDDDSTAFSGGRSPRFGAFIIGMAPDAGLLAVDRGWVRGIWDALRPHAIGGGDGYVNGTADYQQDRVRASYGPAKYQRLAQIKARYDPANVFHLNANIVPARAAVPRQA